MLTGAGSSVTLKSWAWTHPLICIFYQLRSAPSSCYSLLIFAIAIFTIIWGKQEWDSSTPEKIAYPKKTMQSPYAFSSSLGFQFQRQEGHMCQDTRGKVPVSKVMVFILHNAASQLAFVTKHVECLQQAPEVSGISSQESQSITVFDMCNLLQKLIFGVTNQMLSCDSPHFCQFRGAQSNKKNLERVYLVSSIQVFSNLRVKLTPSASTENNFRWHVPFLYLFCLMIYPLQVPFLFKTILYKKSWSNSAE